MVMRALTSYVRVGQPIANPHARDGPILAERIDRFNVVRQSSATGIGGFGKGHGQALGLDHLVVVPHGAPRQRLGANAGNSFSVAARDSSRGSGNRSSGSTPSIAPASQPLIDPERCANRQPVREHGAVRSDDERQRSKEARRNQRERTTLANRLAGAIDSQASAARGVLRGPSSGD